ncbi:hypothetical protein L1887_43615 [Cichorium endivia]|nr:hypothetical protein L1887_43615 [Cichorium endivia]
METMFEEMEFCGSFDFLSAPPIEIETKTHEPSMEDDYSDDEEMAIDELEKRIGTYRPIAGGNLKFQMNNIEKVPLSGMPSFGQTKLVAAPPPPYGGGGSVSELRLPGDGQNMISDLMEFYETNLQQTTGSFNSGNVDPIQVDCGFIGENSGFDSGNNMNVNDNNTLDFRFGEQSSFSQNASIWYL